MPAQFATGGGGAMDAVAGISGGGAQDSLQGVLDQIMQLIERINGTISGNGGAGPTGGGAATPAGDAIPVDSGAMPVDASMEPETTGGGAAPVGELDYSQPSQDKYNVQIEGNSQTISVTSKVYSDPKFSYTGPIANLPEGIAEEIFGAGPVDRPGQHKYNVQIEGHSQMVSVTSKPYAEPQFTYSGPIDHLPENVSREIFG